MDIHHLLYELSIGVRLPSPEFCPFPITALMKECFHADPNERPDFSTIKGGLQTEDQDMNARALSNSNGGANETTPFYATLINEINDNTMRSRYRAVIKGNQKQEKRESVGKIDETSEELDKRLSIGKYASLENMVPLESDNELPGNSETVSVGV